MKHHMPDDAAATATMTAPQPAPERSPAEAATEPGLLGTFDIDGHRFAVYQHQMQAVWVYMYPWARDERHQLGPVTKIGTDQCKAAFSLVYADGELVFDPAWPIAAAVFDHARRLRSQPRQ